MNWTNYISHHMVHTFFECMVAFVCKIQVHIMYIQGVPHLHGFHYHGFWLMYVQVGDFCVSRGFTTIPLTRISYNTVFSKSQNVRKAGTLCTSIWLKLQLSTIFETWEKPYYAKFVLVGTT